MIADGPRVAPEQIRADIHRARQVRRGRQRQFRLAVHDIQVARQHGLAFLDHVHISRAALLRRKDVQRNALARRDTRRVPCAAESGPRRCGHPSRTVLDAWLPS